MRHVQAHKDSRANIRHLAYSAILFTGYLSDFFDRIWAINTQAYTLYTAFEVVEQIHRKLGDTLSLLNYHVSRVGCAGFLKVLLARTDLYYIANQRNFQNIIGDFNEQNGVKRRCCYLKIAYFLEQGVSSIANPFWNGVHIWLIWRPGRHTPTQNLLEYLPPPPPRGDAQPPR